MRFLHPEVVLHWPKPNYVDPEERGAELYIINSIFFSLATIAVFSRFYIRIFVRRWFGLDDCFIVLAWFCGLGDMATIFWGYSHYAWDRHMWDGKPEYLIPGSKTVFVAKIFWTSSSTFTRLSLLAFFYRLLDHVEVLHRRIYRWTLHATTAFVVSIYLCYLGTIIWACDHPANYFVWPSPGYCINEGIADTTLSAFNTFSEFLVAALPVPVVLSLGMEKLQRRTVICLLCLGALVGVVGCVRTAYVWTLFRSDDLTWWSGPHWICSEVEICVAMLCASAPALRPYVGRVIFREKNQRRTKTSNKIQKNRGSAESHTSGTQTTTVDEAWTTSTRWHFDLEGIGVDGFGYTVTITTGQSRPQSRNKSTFRKLAYGGPAMPSRWQFSNPLKGLSRQNSRMSEDEKGAIKIVTRQSLELRESFCEEISYQHCWDHRNRTPYTKAHFSDGGTSNFNVNDHTVHDEPNFFDEDSDAEGRSGSATIYHFGKS